MDSDDGFKPTSSWQMLHWSDTLEAGLGAVNCFIFCAGRWLLQNDLNWKEKIGSNSHLNKYLSEAKASFDENFGQTIIESPCL